LRRRGSYSVVNCFAPPRHSSQNIVRTIFHSSSPSVRITAHLRLMSCRLLLRETSVAPWWTAFAAAQLARVAIV